MIKLEKNCGYTNNKTPSLLRKKKLRTKNYCSRPINYNILNSLKDHIIITPNSLVMMKLVIRKRIILREQIKRKVKK